MLASAVSGAKASVSLSAPSLDAEVLGIALLSYCRNAESSPDTMRALLHHPAWAADGVQAPFVAPSTYIWHADIVEICPDDDLPFQTADLADLELGWEVT
jgi:hypothetical protein